MINVINLRSLLLDQPQAIEQGFQCKRCYLNDKHFNLELQTNHEIIRININHSHKITQKTYQLNNNKDHCAIYQPVNSLYESFQTGPLFTGYLKIDTINYKMNEIRGCFSFAASNPLFDTRVDIKKTKFNSRFLAHS